MSEQTRSRTGGSSNQEAIDLTKLHAHKELHTQNLTEVHQPVNTDLTSVSIQSTNVVRLSISPEKRRVNQMATSKVKHTDVNAKTKTTPKPTKNDTASHGVFTNPFFRYEGNIFERFITFLANLLKVFELTLLRSLKPSPTTPVQSAQRSSESNGSVAANIGDEEKAQKVTIKKKRKLFRRR